MEVKGQEAPVPESVWVSLMFSVARKDTFLSTGGTLLVGHYISPFSVTVMKYPGKANFIKRRSLYSSQFWRFKEVVPATAWLWRGPLGGWQEGGVIR